jgi:uncharacterized protein (DUF1810 family)
LNAVDSFNLERFVKAQADVYPQVLRELHSGRKRSHWIWFIFPQIIGLGHSPTSQFFAIRSLEEARAYLNHPILGARLKECTSAVLNGDEDSAERIFGQPDTMKFRSSLTLFARIAEEGSVFHQALERFFGGEPDPITQTFVETHRKAQN